MAQYNLDRLAILLVEDNSYIRSLLHTALKALGIGTVKTAKEGGEAIEFIKLVQSNPVKAGIMSIDMIISNWQMSPVDGSMFLRWVRRHKESTDRFVPFVMLTGYADEDKVAEARDLGVTEMLAKPFSVDTVANKVLQVIERPRQFVHTSNYFGPDRRRQVLPYHGDDRRKLKETDEAVEVVYDSAGA
ncbi:MAG TPA: response regulator [Candidatus Cybelea sp.]|nr:response regulator [Candidatus Cybelea sp.]